MAKKKNENVAVVENEVAVTDTMAGEPTAEVTKTRRGRKPKVSEEQSVGEQVEIKQDTETPETTELTNEQSVGEQVEIKQDTETPELTNEEPANNTAGAVVLERANRISIHTIDDIFAASYYKTHKFIKRVEQAETGYVPDTNITKSAQRENFRRYMTENAEKFGIKYDPVDRRTGVNARSAKYESDQLLYNDTEHMISDDITAFIAALPENISTKIKSWHIDTDGIEPMDKTARGIMLENIGIIGGKYGNGNWAWANVGMTVVLELTSGDETYVQLNCQLVSGQLKKPTNICNNGYTKTSFIIAVTDELKILGLIPQDNKEESAE